MGIFWLVNGIIILRWGIRRRRKKNNSYLSWHRRNLTGSLVLIGWPFPRALDMFILGSVILITGLLRVMALYNGRERNSSKAKEQHILRLLRDSSWLVADVYTCEV
jgi:uncharacterized membrane protein HdeD (DUF308 family)